MARKSVPVGDYIEVDRTFLNKHLDMAMSDLAKAISRTQKLQDKESIGNDNLFDSINAAHFSLETRLRSMRNYMDEVPNYDSDLLGDDYPDDMVVAPVSQPQKHSPQHDNDKDAASCPKKLESNSSQNGAPKNQASPKSV